MISLRCLVSVQRVQLGGPVPRPAQCVAGRALGLVRTAYDVATTESPESAAIPGLRSWLTPRFKPDNLHPDERRGPGETILSSVASVMSSVGLCGYLRRITIRPGRIT